MFYVALRILLYDKIRSLITLLGVIFAVGLIFNQAGIFLGLMETSSVIIDNTPGDIWITSKNSKNFDFSQPIPEYIRYQVAAEPGIEWAHRLIVGWGVIRQKQGGNEQLEIVGYDPDTGVGGPWDMVVGDRNAVKNGNFAIVDESAEKRLGKITVGEYRDVVSHRMQIVGICRGVKSFTTAPILFTSFDVARGLIPYMGTDSTVFVVAKTAPGVSVDKVVESLRARIPSVDAYASDDFSYRTRRYWAVETGVGFSFFLTIVISFIVGMLIVGQTIYNSTMEHIKEFGTLKALGGTNLDIYRIIFFQALLNALLGYIISLAITMASIPLYDAGGLALVIRGWVNLTVLALTLFMCLMAAFVSIRRIRKIDPAILFRG